MLYNGVMMLSVKTHSQLTRPVTNEQEKYGAALAAFCRSPASYQDISSFFPPEELNPSILDYAGAAFHKVATENFNEQKLCFFYKSNLLVFL